MVDDGACIRIWTRDTIPERFAHLARLADDGEVQNTVFVAHVPAAMLADPTYRVSNGQSGTDGWMREGELGPFGVNALDIVPHPDGDGVFLVGSWL
jgi:hypothetical protein